MLNTQVDANNWILLSTEQRQRCHLRRSYGSAPTGIITITGTVAEGETLTADISAMSDPDGIDTSTITYQWKANDTAISGATSSTYALADGDSQANK